MWTEPTIFQLLKTNDRAVARGMVAIWQRQTAGEQGARATWVQNGVGFSASDAKRGSAWAARFLRGDKLDIGEMAAARKLILKYRRQLLAIALENEAAKAGG